MSDPHASTDLPSQPALPRRRWWARMLLYLIIFASGSAVGGGSALIIVRNSIIRAVHHPDDMPKLIAQRMRRALELSDEQGQQVEAVLRERQVALQDIRRKYQPQVEAELDRLEDQISEILDADQQANWRKRFEDLRHTWIPAPPLKSEPMRD